MSAELESSRVSAASDLALAGRISRVAVPASRPSVRLRVASRQRARASLLEPVELAGG
jgi:hypothetical protein